MNLTLAEHEFARLRRLLADAAGLVFDETRRESLAYSVGERVRATAAPSVEAYLDLVADPLSAERQELLDEVTIQETYFFRNPPQVRALRAYVLPDILRVAAAGQRRVRIWSAGCSTGEEAYTLAMLLREQLPGTDGWDVRVLGTDVSRRALAAAEAAVYGRRAVGHARPDDLARFFLPTGDGRYVVRDEIRELVEFRHHNLVTEPVPFAPGELDLVLCRNVTIYFGRETTRDVMRRMHESLRDGGYLFLGHAETLWQITDEFRLVALGTGDSAAFVYRRLDPMSGPDRRRVLPDRRTGDDGVQRERRVAPRRAPEQLRPQQPSVPAQPGGRTDLLDEARAAMAAADYDVAARLAETVAVADPLRADAHRLRGECLVALGRDEDALVALRKAVYLDPDDALAHFQLAGSLARRHDPVAAAREYRAAAAVLARRPRSAPAAELGGRDVAEFVALCARLADDIDSATSGAR